jgi:filamentous hemagglutinin family protein
MNARCFKTIFSEHLGCLVAVGEHACSQGKSSGESPAGTVVGAAGSAVAVFMGALVLSMAWVSLAWSSPVANALPTAGQVVQGAASMVQSSSPTTSQLTINQSTQRAAINWQSFDIGASAKVQVVQPNAQAVLLNRVVGQTASQIFGQLQANGHVILVNPNGVLFGKDGSVNAGSFTASTLGITDADFMVGNMVYQRNGSTAGVVNQGTLTVVPGGYVVLMGASVSNEGKIIAPQGGVALGSAATIRVPVSGSGRIKLELSAADINASVSNKGQIVSQGGQVYMQALALNRAAAQVIQSGSIDTSGEQAGSAHLLADGGTIKVDGSITANSSGTDDKGQSRKGGDIVIGRDEETGVLAHFTDVSTAKLESQRGFVETSGDHLRTERVSVKAAQWLLDPSDITISSAADSNVSGTSPADMTPTGGDGSTSVVSVSTIQSAINAGTNVTLKTTNASNTTGAGNITIADTLSLNNTGAQDATLSLVADNGIIQNAAITATGIKLLHINMTANGNFQGIDAVSTSSQGITLNAGITTNGNVTLRGTNKNTNGSNRGVTFANGAGITANTITVTGTATGAAEWNQGVFFNGTSSIRTTGTGNSVISGTSSSTAGAINSAVVFNDGSNVTLDGGTGGLTIQGMHTVNGYGGIRFGANGGSSTNPSLTTRGNVTLGTQDANNASLNAAFMLRGGLITADTGSLTIRGQGTGTGINFFDGFSTIRSNGGSIMLNGVATSSGHGILFNSNQVGTLNSGGDVTITGTSSGTGNSGVNFNGGNVRVFGNNVTINATANTASGQTGFGFRSVIGPGAGNTITAAGNLFITGTVNGAGSGTAVAQQSTSWQNLVNAYTSGGALSITGINNAASSNTSATITMAGLQARAGGDLTVRATTNNAATDAISIFSNGYISGVPAPGYQGGASSLASTSGDVMLQTNQGGILFNDGVPNNVTPTTLSGRNISIDNTGGTIDANTGAISRGLGSGSSGISISDGRAFTATGNINLYGAGTSGSGVAISGAATLSAANINIHGENTSTGGAAINMSNAASSLTASAGVILTSGGTGSGTSLVAAGNISVATQLKIMTPAAGSIAGVISGTGSLLKMGAGQTKLTAFDGTTYGTNTFSGGTTISQGTLLLGNGGGNYNKTAGTGGITLGDANTGSSNVALLIEKGKDSSQDSGKLSRAITVTNNGTGTATIGGATGTGAGWTAINGSITLNRDVIFNDSTGDRLSIDGKITGTGNITLTGYRLTMSSSVQNDFVGDFTVSAGSILQSAANVNLAFSQNHNLIVNGDWRLYSANPSINSLTGSGTVTTYGGAPLLSIGNNNGGGVFSGVMSGAMSLIKNGTGTQILSGANSYTGTTTINGGTLQIGNGGTSGALGTGVITDNAALVFNRTDAALVVGAKISGTGTVTQAGTGTTTLSADNDWSGTTTISAGTLQIGNGGTTGTLGTSTTVTNNGTLAFKRSDNISVGQKITGTGGLTQAGTGKVTLMDSASLNGVNDYSGVTTVVGGATLEVGNGGTSGNLGSGTITDNGSLIINRSDAVAITTVISGTGSLSQSGLGTTTLSGTNTYSGGTNVVTGILKIGDGTNNGQIGSNTVNIASGAVLDFNVKASTSANYSTGNTFTGTGTLKKSGAGTLTWGSASGVFAMTGGLIDVQAGSFVGSNSGNEVWTNNKASLNVAGGAVFAGVEGNIIVDALTGGGAVSSGYPGFAYGLTVGVNNGSGTFSGVIQDSNGQVAKLTKTGTGTQILTGTNTYTGVTTVSGGVLQVGNGGTTGALGTGAVSNNASLIFNRSNTQTVANAISGSGTLTQSGAGTTILTGSNSYTGDTTISTGTLQVGNGGTSGTLGTGAVVDNAALVLNRSDALLVTNAISGAGTLAQAGAGTTTLAADNSYAGTTAVSGGTLQVGNGGSTGTLGVGAVTLSNNALLSYVRAADTSIANNISGTGSVSASITGTGSDLTVSNAIALSGGTVNLAADGNLSVTQGISTTNATANALVLNAGKATNAGTATGGDIGISGSGALTVGSGGRATLFTGSLAGSTGMGIVAGNNRYSSDELTTAYSLTSAALGAGTYAIYREAPILSVRFNDASKTYNGQAFTGGSGLTVVSGLVNGDTAPQLSGISYSGTSQSAVNAGDYVISGTAVSGLGYSLAYTAGNLTVNKANLVLSGTRVYDSGKTFAGQYLTATGVNNEAFAVTGAGDASNLSSKNVQTGQLLSSVTGLALGASTGTTAGLSTNYNAISTTGSSVSVTAKAATVDATSTTVTYSGAVQAQAAPTSSGFIAGDLITISGAASGQNAGSYASSLAVTGNDVGNYSVTRNDANLVILKAALTVTGNSSAVTYNGVNQSVAGFTMSGLQGSDAMANLSSVMASGATGKNAGAYTNTVTAGSETNYTVSTVNGSLQIAKAALTATGNSSTVTYNGVNQSVAGFTVSGLQGSDTTANLSSIQASGAMAKNAGTYSNTVTAGSETNYTVTAVNGALQIDKANLIATGNSSSVTYNGVNQSVAGFTVSGLQGSDTAANLSSVSAAGATAKNVGTYTNTVTAGTETNYNVSTVNGSLQIGKANLVLSGTRVYDGGKTFEGQYLTATGVAGESFAISGAGDASNLSSKNVQTNQLLSTLTGLSLGSSNNGGLSTNYNAISTTGSSVSVTAKAATVTGTATNVTYNGSSQTQSAPASSGFIAGDSISFSGEASGKNAGTYTSSLFVGGADAGNYNVTVSNADLVIAKAALTVTASQVSKTYDGGLGATGTGTVGALAGAAAGDVVNNAGAQAFLDKDAGTGKSVRASGVTIKDAVNADMSGNYTITYVDNTTSTINKAALTVTANADARFVTQSDAAGFNGVSYAGFVGGENSSVLGGSLAISRTNVATQGAGAYTGVLEARGLSSGNYEISYANGNYTIVPANQLLIKTANTSVTYGSAPVFNTTAQYLLDDGVHPSQIVTLTRSGSGGNYSFTDGAGGSVSMTLSPYALNSNVAAAVSSSGHTVVGNYDIKALNPAVVGSNFVGSPVFVGALTVDTKAVTPNATGVSKVYDATTSMNNVVIGLSGKVDSDHLTISGTGAFSQKNVGTGLGYTVSGIMLNGTDAANYHLSGGSNSLTGSDGVITAAALKITTSDVSKTYDRSLGAQGVAQATQDTQLFGSDALSGGTFAFTNWNAGAGNKVVTVSGVTLNDGNGGANYVVSYVDNTTSTITPKSLTATYNASSRPYNSSTTAVVTGSSSDVISGDAVSFSNTSANFGSKDVGIGKTVTVSGIGIGGADSGNYTLQNTTATTTADISAKSLTASFSAASRAYNGGVAASVTGSSGDIVGSDVVTFTTTSANFDTKDVGTGKVVSVAGIGLSGADAGNYALQNTSVSTTGTITPKDVSISSLTASNKVYDGTRTASITSGAVTTGVGSETLFISGTGTFSDKNAGTGKTVTVADVTTLSKSDGTGDWRNYNLISTGSMTTAADITQAALTVTASAATKTYDGTLDASGAGTVGALAAIGDSVNNIGQQAFLDKNAGTGKSVRASGVTIKDASNADMTGNYAITYVDNTSSVIDKAALKVTVNNTAMFVTQDPNTAFNQGFSFEGLKNGESGANVLGPLTRSYTGAANPATGSYASVFGLSTVPLADNYTVTVQKGDLTVVAADKLLINVGGKSETYGALTASNAGASANTVVAQYCLVSTDCNGANLANLAMSRQGNLWTATDVSNSTIRFNTVVDTAGHTSGGAYLNAGRYTYAADGLTTSGAVNFNGTVVSGGVLTVDAKQLTFSASNVSKVYDGTTVLAGMALTPNGVLAGDSVGVSASGGTFSSKNAGSQTFSLTGLQLLGSDRGNYGFAGNSLSGTGTITPKTLSLMSSVLDKTYDGTTAATGSLSTGNVIGHDDVQLNWGPVTFASKDVSRDAQGQVQTQAVNFAGVQLSGLDAGNYSVDTTASGSAKITPKRLSVSGTSVANKSQDGNTVATAQVGRLTGLVGLEQLQAQALASFDSAMAGSNKPVTVRYRLGNGANGGLGGNYELPDQVLSASILARSGGNAVQPVKTPVEGTPVGMSAATATLVQTESRDACSSATPEKCQCHATSVAGMEICMPGLKNLQPNVPARGRAFVQASGL